jgi:Outer membrane protein beta-barrel domain
MKRLISILFTTCMLWSLTGYGQEPRTKTTTTTTTTTEPGATPDTVVVAAPDTVVVAAPDTVVVAAPDTVVMTTPDTVVVKQAVQTESNPSKEWSGFHIGAVAQATFTDVNIESDGDEISTSYVVGYGGGGYIGYFFSSHVEARVEVLYSSLAQQIEENGSKRDLKLSYLNFPILLGLHTGYDKPVSFNVMFGPQFGINTGSTLEGSGGEGVDTVQASVKIKPTDFGIAYGAGFDFGLGPDRLVHLNVGFRGVYGLVDISDQSQTTTTPNYYVIDRANLKTYSAYAGLSFKF